jgi:hypothetical protein
MLYLRRHSPVKKLLGAGHSGQVFLIQNPENNIARKIFFEDKLANLVHYFFFGVPNPYVWNEDILNCAYYRRHIITKLVPFWFNSQLKVANAISRGWNEEYKAYQLDTEFIQGRHVALRQPYQHQSYELQELVHSIMIPLQQYLIQAGLDGLVWQAGKGSTSALNNFLLQEDTSGEYFFVWIDLESGVPALFPLNILTLFSFYLPQSFKNRGPLFDDVDINQLKQYIDKHKLALENKLGHQAYLELLEYINYLEHHQKKWKSLKRFDRSLQYHLKKGHITQQQAYWYSRYRLCWYGRELMRIFLQFNKTLFIALPKTIFNKFKQVRFKSFFQQFWKFLFSHHYRLKMARIYVEKRIKKWQKRKQLTSEAATDLSANLYSENASNYLNDFGVHVGIKGFITLFDYVLIPILYSVGIIDEIVSLTWLVIDGPIYRTIYTFFRIIQSASKRQEIPWIAFLVGLLPSVGTLAYPCQMIYSAAINQDKVAQFIVYDFFTTIGARIPVWGGKDTLTEHFFNGWAEKIIRWLGGRKRNLNIPVEK